jgi:hypothetical protein
VEAVLLLLVKRDRENKTKGTEQKRGKNVFTTIQSKDESQNNTEKKGRRPKNACWET